MASRLPRSLAGNSVASLLSHAHLVDEDEGKDDDGDPDDDGHGNEALLSALVVIVLNDLASSDPLHLVLDVNERLLVLLRALRNSGDSRPWRSPSVAGAKVIDEGLGACVVSDDPAKGLNVSVGVNMTHEASKTVVSSPFFKITVCICSIDDTIGVPDGLVDRLEGDVIDAIGASLNSRVNNTVTLRKSVVCASVWDLISIAFILDPADSGELLGIVLCLHPVLQICVSGEAHLTGAGERSGGIKVSVHFLVPGVQVISLAVKRSDLLEELVGLSSAEGAIVIVVSSAEVGLSGCVPSRRADLVSVALPSVVLLLNLIGILEPELLQEVVSCVADITSIRPVVEARETTDDVEARDVGGASADPLGPGGCDTSDQISVVVPADSYFVQLMSVGIEASHGKVVAHLVGSFVSVDLDILAVTVERNVGGVVLSEGLAGAESQSGGKILHVCDDWFILLIDACLRL